MTPAAMGADAEVPVWDGSAGIEQWDPPEGLER
jgi:hypothetical protein